MIYLQLFWSFLQIGLFSFGGGYAAMPLIQNQVVVFYIVPECFYLWGRICDHYPDEEKICR